MVRRKGNVGEMLGCSPNLLGDVSPGNSHSRGILPLLAIPDAPSACIAHWARRTSVPQNPLSLRNSAAKGKRKIP